MCFRTRFLNLVKPGHASGDVWKWDKLSSWLALLTPFRSVFTHCIIYQSQQDWVGLLSCFFLMTVAMSLFWLDTKGLAPNPDIIWPEARSSPKLISASLLYPRSTNDCPNFSFLLVTCSFGTQFLPDPFQLLSHACSLPSPSEEQQGEEADAESGRQEDKKYTIWGGVLQDRPRTKWAWLVFYQKSGNHWFF